MASLIARDVLLNKHLYTRLRNGTSTSTPVYVYGQDQFSFTGGGKGDLIHTVPFSFTKRRKSLEGAIIYTKPSYLPASNDGWVSSREGCFLNYLGYPQLVSAHFPEVFNFGSLYNRALERFYEKVDSGSNLNLAVDVAEYKQLRRMVPSALKAAGEVLNLANRCKSMPGGLASAWLGYQYGWRPLLSTIFGLAEFARSSARDGIKVVASQHDRITRQASAYLGTRFDIDLNVSRVCKVGGVYDVRDPLLHDASRLSTLNPALLAWELLPYSFVVDWFIDIGGYLQLAEKSFGAGLQFRHGFRVDSFKGRLINVSPKGPQPGGDSNIAFWEIQGLEEVSYLSRTVLSSFPVPQLPSFEPDLGSARLLSAAALLQTIFFRR